jgi:tRNA (guanine6-N2)-methyltransferase
VISTRSSGSRADGLTNLLDVELECIEGLCDVAGAELGALPVNAVEPIVRERSVVACVTSLEGIVELRCPVAAYLVVSRGGAKPTTLVGDSGLVDACAMVLGSDPDGAFTSFGIDMPGKDSPAARRIRDVVAAATGVRFEKERGQLLVRVRRVKDGWQALVRLTPKPLSTRSWRTQSVPGAVNACVAASMVRLLEPSPDDAFLNLMCGSGTLAIERALHGPAARIVALDNDPDMVRIAEEHGGRAGVSDRIEVVEGDAMSTGLADASFDALAAVLPYGFRIGTHDDNVAGYGAVLQESARVATSDARFALLTQEVTLIESAISQQRAWSLRESRRIWQGGHRPSLCILTRAST